MANKTVEKKKMGTGNKAGKHSGGGGKSQGKETAQNNADSADEPKAAKRGSDNEGASKAGSRSKSSGDKGTGGNRSK